MMTVDERARIETERAATVSGETTIGTALAPAQGARVARGQGNSLSEEWVDRVQRDSIDSFPASDPPSWAPLQLGPPAPREHGDSDRP
jgi:hypothetical protein